MNDHEVFWLARHAHNTLAPLIKDAQEVDPSIRLSIEMRFENPNVEFGGGRVSAYGHWARKDGMFIYSTWITSKENIAQLAAEVRDKISALQPVSA